MSILAALLTVGFFRDGLLYHRPDSTWAQLRLLIYGACSILYFTFPVGRYGRTLAQALAGLRVVANSGPANYTRALLRCLFFPLPVLALTYSLIFEGQLGWHQVALGVYISSVVISSLAWNQSLQDYCSGTAVVESDFEGSSELRQEESRFQSVFILAAAILFGMAMLLMLFVHG